MTVDEEAGSGWSPITFIPPIPYMAIQPVPLNTQSLSTQRFQTVSGSLADLVTYLQYSEYALVAFLQEQGVWKGPQPAPPAGYTKGAGNIDYGIYLYWLRTPTAVARFGNADLDGVLLLFLFVLKLYSITLPASLLTRANYNLLSGTQLIYSDGSVISVASYALYDPNWLYSVINQGLTLVNLAVYNDGKLPSAPVKPVPLMGSQAGLVSIGLIADWGAGTSASKSVMTGLLGLSPDYLIHLGDIYYSGSPSADSPLNYRYANPGETQTNFLDTWPQVAYAGKSFTLNGNHEMYCGANGLFGEVLSQSAFQSQAGLSYAALRVGDWTILCLDSAYYSTDLMYMYGRIGGAAGVQGAWITSLKLDPQKVIVLTHHNAFDPACSADLQQSQYQPFWNEVRGALGGDPYAWYWGHVHNAIVYQSPLTIGNFTTRTQCRCVGNGSMPYGKSTAFDPPASGASPFAWCAQYSYTGPGALPQGFARLVFELDAQQQVTTLREAYYLVDKPTQPAFQHTLFARPSQP